MTARSAPQVGRGPARTDGPYSAPNLLLRATPFIGASVLGSTLASNPDLTNLRVTTIAAVAVSMMLILSAAARVQWQALPRLARPFPASLALVLSSLPVHGSPVSNPSGYVTLAAAVAVPYTMDVIPWGRLPRWVESVALLGAISLLLLGRPETDTDQLLMFPIINIVILFLALYGNRLELIVGVIIVGLQFGLPTASRPPGFNDGIHDLMLTAMVAIVGICVHQVVTVMRRQRLRIQEDEQEARLREAWIQSVLENTADGLVTIDVGGQILSINRAARRMFGYPASEIAGRGVDLFIAPAGQVDFIDYLRSRVDSARDGIGSGSRESIGRRADGTEFPIEYDANDMNQGQSRVLIVSLRDITDRKAATDALRKQALHDVLTGLPNRSLFHDRFIQALAHAERDGSLAAVLMMDFNDFKQVNDRYGHEVGDRVLQEVSGRISAALRASDTVARVGGDEFVVVSTGIQTPADAARVAGRIISSVGTRLIINGQELAASVSIGIALYPSDGRDEETLIGQADAAMYLAKHSGIPYAYATAAPSRAVARAADRRRPSIPAPAATTGSRR